MTATRTLEPRTSATPAAPVRPLAGQSQPGFGRPTSALRAFPGAEVQAFAKHNSGTSPVLSYGRILDTAAQAEWTTKVVSPT